MQHFRKLRITGPGAQPYALDQPMFVYDRNMLLATLEPVPLLKSGTEIHVESFNPTHLVRQDYRHVGRLIFLEICAFVSERFPQIQAINFAFSRRVDILGGGEQQAMERAEAMDRIGAINVRIRPKPNALPGHFVVSGVWAYSEQNVAALKQVLEEERALYRKRPIGSRTPDRSKVLGAIRQWVTGRAAA
ncbi:hypothetical protein [Variovorax sp. dw_308]|nr:hypothetical protein [Variovorax sp. dw_308]